MSSRLPSHASYGRTLSMAIPSLSHLWDSPDEDEEEVVVKKKEGTPPISDPESDDLSLSDIFSTCNVESRSTSKVGLMAALPLPKVTSHGNQRTLSSSSNSSWTSSYGNQLNTTTGSRTSNSDAGDVAELSPHGFVLPPWKKSSVSETLNRSANDSGYGNSLTGLDGPLSSPPLPLKFGNNTKKLSKYLNTVPPAPDHAYAEVLGTLEHVSEMLSQNTKAAAATILSTIWSPVPPPQGMTQETTIRCIEMVKSIQAAVQAGKVKDYLLKLAPKPPKRLQQFRMHQLSHDAGAARMFKMENTGLEQIQLSKAQRELGGLTGKEIIWRGRLPRRSYRNVVFSCKVFLGGMPRDITELGIIQALKPFGNVKVEWPRKETSYAHHEGFAYAIFDNEKQVKLLLQHSDHDWTQDGRWFYHMSSRRVRMKRVEVIPWSLSDSTYSVSPSATLDPRTTVFVGGLHGVLNAEGLFAVMDNLFGGVVSSRIDTDRHRYPTGSGQVTFNNFQSYFKSIVAAYVEIQSTKFGKTVQIDPYLQDATCSICRLQQAPYFCRDLQCFKYFCCTCFEKAHAAMPLRSHRPLTRNAHKGKQPVMAFVPLGRGGNGNSYQQPPPPGFGEANGYTNSGVQGQQFGRTQGCGHVNPPMMGNPMNPLDDPAYNYNWDPRYSS